MQSLYNCFRCEKMRIALRFSTPPGIGVSAAALTTATSQTSCATASMSQLWRASARKNARFARFSSTVLAFGGRDLERSGMELACSGRRSIVRSVTRQVATSIAAVGTASAILVPMLHH